MVLLISEKSDFIKTIVEDVNKAISYWQKGSCYQKYLECKICMHAIIEIQDKGKKTQLKGEINTSTNIAADFNITLWITERKKQTNLNWCI